ISVHITQVGNTSFTFATEMRDAHAGNIVATTETVCVAVDGTTLTKKPLSEEIKALLLAGAPGVQVDHAGLLSQPHAWHTRTALSCKARVCQSHRARWLPNQ